MKLTNKDNVIYFTFKKHDFLLLNAQNGVWRLLSACDGKFDLNGAAQTLSNDLGEKRSFLQKEISVYSNKVKSADGSYVVLGNSIDFYNSDGVLKRSLVDVYDTEDGIAAELSLSDDECLFGTGERFNCVNQRGKRIDVFAVDRWCGKNGNSYVPIPFVLSSDCNALFLNRYERSVLDLGKKNKKRIVLIQKYSPLDLYIFLADKPEKILTAYSELTGFAPMPCDWAFGTLVCRYRPDFSTKEGVIAMAEAMEKNGFPWEAVIAESWVTYNDELWDELKELCDYLRKKGKRLMVYQQCAKFPMNYKDLGLTDDMAVSSANGILLDQTHSLNLLDNFSKKRMRCIDLTNADAMKKWNEIWGKLVNDIGVDGSKIDFCEQFPDSEDIAFADGRNPRGAHHWFPTLYNILQYKLFNSSRQCGLNFSRGGGIGAQRYPFIWAGDQRREFNFLGAVIKAALSLGFSGVPFVSWDMAGYRSAFLPLDKLMENKIFIRAVEFTAFAPNIQTHGTVKRPYDFDEHTRDVYRAYTLLHDALRPYLKQQAEISCKTGLPMMRHLFLHDCTDSRLFTVEDEYMLGDALLVAPILNKGSRRDICLPKGEWENIFTGERFSGGQTLKKYKVPLESVPVFKNLNVDTSVLDAALESGKKYIEEINKLSK